MSPHPDRTALAAFVLGHHDEIADCAALEAHVGECEACLDEVGREARLEMLLDAAGGEDAFAAVVEVPRRRPRWPLVAAAAGVAAVAAAAGAYALWPSEVTPAEMTIVEVTPGQASPAVAPLAGPDWARGIKPGTVRCSRNGGDITCAAAAFGTTREDAEAAAADVAIEALSEIAFLRGGPAIVAQRKLYTAARSEALRVPVSEAVRRARRRVASRAGLGRRDGWYWEEYSEGEGPEFMGYVRFVASKKEVEEVLAGYRAGSTDGAELWPIVPGVRWALDPGEDMAWFVHRPGKLAKLGVRAGDVLLMNQRLNANRMRALVKSDRVQVWRAGLEAPVPPSKLR